MVSTHFFRDSSLPTHSPAKAGTSNDEHITAAAAAGGGVSETTAAVGGDDVGSESIATTSPVSFPPLSSTQSAPSPSERNGRPLDQRRRSSRNAAKS